LVGGACVMLLSVLVALGVGKRSQVVKNS